MYFKSLWNDFAALPEVEAIALGGSRVGTDYDEKSDYDLYIYCTSIPDECIRSRILERYCQYMEIGNSFWELEDDCTLKDGVDIDILYRNIRKCFMPLLKSIQRITAIQLVCGIIFYTAGFFMIKMGIWPVYKISIEYLIQMN